MARGLFVVGFTQEEVEDILAKAKTFLLEGKTLMSWGESGSSASKEFAMPVREVLDECQHALRILDPGTYGRQRSVGTTVVLNVPK
ncbi:hypothetical protein EBZ39_03225 [bacterium]|nr:hypothetical protein [bacterium]